MRSHRTHFIAQAAGVVWLAIFVLACGGAASGPASTAAPIGMPASTRFEATGGGTSNDDAGQGNGGKQPDQDAVTDSAYIVRTGSLNVEVADLQATVQQAQGLVTGLGGYVSGSKEANDGSDTLATITYRVPVDRWFDALNGLRALGTRVVAENTEASDVTADVVDLDARLINLRSAETQYQSIMARATTIDDVLKVQKVLNDTRGQIEQLQGQRDTLANRAALATLTVSWQVPTTAVTVANQGWDPGREIDHAVAALVTFGQGLATLAIWLLIAFLPIALPVAVVAFVAYRVLHRRSNRVTMEVGTPADG